MWGGTAPVSGEITMVVCGFGFRSHFFLPPASRGSLLGWLLLILKIFQLLHDLADRPRFPPLLDVKLPFSPASLPSLLELVSHFISFCVSGFWVGRCY